MRIWIHKLEAAWRKHAYQRSSMSFHLIGAPLSLIYWLLSNLKRLIFWKIPGNQIRVSNRVISVGNLTVGGSGKTPVVKYCLELLKNRSVCLISRGYGAQFQGSLLVMMEKLKNGIAKENLEMKYMRYCAYILQSMLP